LLMPWLSAIAIVLSATPGSASPEPLAQESQPIGRRTMFTVIVEGVEHCAREGRVEIDLDSLASYVEIYDASSREMVGNVYLMGLVEPGEEPWKAEDELTSGGRLRIEVASIIADGGGSP